MTKPPPQQERSRRTVARILVAADRLIAGQGSAATTTAIAAEAGVSVGALYRFFPNKHAIGQALADRYLDVAAGRFSEILDSIDALDEVPDALRAVVKVAADLALEHPAYYRLTNEQRPDEAGSVGFGVRNAMIDTFDSLLVTLGTGLQPPVRRAAVTMAIETVRHALAIAPVSEPDRTIVVGEVAEMLALYAVWRLAR